MFQDYGIGNYAGRYGDWVINHETEWKNLRVIAWMPLPEPPKENLDPWDELAQKLREIPNERP